MACNVLLVEDDLTKGAAIKTALEAKGHQVTWILGIVKGSGGSFETHTPDGGNGKVSLADFQVALVDGVLKGFHSDGSKLIRPLLRQRIVCVGISGEGKFNSKLLEAGAHHALPKEQVIDSLVSGTLELDALVAQHRV